MFIRLNMAKFTIRFLWYEKNANVGSYGTVTVEVIPAGE